MSVSYKELEKATRSLEKALAQELNEYTRDACVQRFEYTFELVWKVAKKKLSELGIDRHSPKEVIREMGVQAWIDDVELWLEFLKMRNLTSHTYKEDFAKDVYKSAKKFPEQVHKLLDVLQKK